jgi:Winged helix DNA-binding domain
MPRIDTATRRARLGVRHHLAQNCLAATPEQVACDLVALHGTDPASVFLSIGARLGRPSIADIERAMYVDRSLVRMLGMRRTVFSVPVEIAPVVQAACTRAIAAQERKRTLQLLAQGTDLTGDLARWFSDLEDVTQHALGKRGEATAQELADDVPALRTPIRFNEDKSYGGVQNVVTRVLSQLAADGRIVRAQPRGSWTSSQFRWSSIERWLPGGLRDLTLAAAQVELVRRWLRAFGPGTLNDLKWWTGLTMSEVKRALASIDVVEVALDDGRGLVLADDAEPVAAPEPWIALLPALDPTPMGYTERDWFLGPHAPRLFDRSGNIGPTIWADGRVVGGWAQRKNGTIAFKLLEDIGAALENQVAHAAELLGTWLGDVRVTPRFRTPLERELSA